MIYKELLSFVLFLLLPMSEGAIPGTFFWRPRMGIDLAIPSTELAIAAYEPNKQNIRAGLVVLINGYDTLTSLLGLMSGIQYASDDDSMNPLNANYYNTAYRWSLRAISSFPYWLRGNFHDALAVWRNRFKYMDDQVPKWMRKGLSWIPAKSWDEETTDLKKFRKFSEAAFSPFYRFPSKQFSEFLSFIPGSEAAFVFSSVERDASGPIIETEAQKKALQKKLKGEKEKEEKIPDPKISTITDPKNPKKPDPKNPKKPDSKQDTYCNPGQLC